MFWDASAVVGLLTDEPVYAGLQALRDDAVVHHAVWWGTRVECASALYRKQREGMLTAAPVSRAEKRLDALLAGFREIEPHEAVRARALRVLRLHPLRASGALQLAAALVFCREHPTGFGLVSLDRRLREAAVKEGFTVRLALEG